MIAPGAHKTNLSYRVSSFVAFIMKALILSMLVEIHIVKRQKEMLFPCLFFKLFVDYQRISLTRLLNGFICNQKAYIINIFNHSLACVIGISKVARRDLKNI